MICKNNTHLARIKCSTSSRPGPQQNTIQRLVIVIGTRQFVTYSTTWATHLGDPADDIMTNYLFFDGPNLKPDRLMQITTKVDNSVLYKKSYYSTFGYNNFTKNISPFISHQIMKQQHYFLRQTNLDVQRAKYINSIPSLLGCL
jgi:hypothetical protein